MRCPVCEDIDLAISSREGVEIDFCPQCRGVWLDRGELDKVIDRVAVEPPDRAPEPSRGRVTADDDRYHDDRYDDDRSDHRRGDPRRRRRRSFLDDLFEFD